MLRKLNPPPTARRAALLPRRGPAFPGRRWLPALASLLLLLSVSFPTAFVTRLVAPQFKCDPASDGFPDLPITRGHSGTDDPSDCPDGPGFPAEDPAARESLQPPMEQGAPAAPARGALDPRGPHAVPHSPDAFPVLRL